MRKQISKGSVNDNFAKSISDLYEMILANFRKNANSYIIEHSGWDQHVQVIENELVTQLKTFITAMREKEMDKLQKITEEDIKDQLENIINGPVYNLEDDFWDHIRVPYINKLSAVKDSCERILFDGFDCDDFECEDFIGGIEDNVYKFTTEYIKRLFKDINQNLIRRFGKIFKKDE